MIMPTGSDPIVIDSSGWLEYITGDDKSALYAPYFENAGPVLVPVVVLFEVRKILMLRGSQTLAEIFISEALSRDVISIDGSIALDAAGLSIRHKLAMADALLYATAQSRQAEFVTSDVHFQGLAGVTLI